MATILIVDDRAINREVLVLQLSRKGHRLIEASDGADALQLARSERPDLIITDLVMPTMDGYEMVRLLRTDPALAETRVIFYSATLIEPEARRLAAACGVIDVITKPCATEDIERRVAAALDMVPTVGAVPVVDSEFHVEHLRLLTNKLTQKVDELERVNAGLERRVAERTQELQEKNSRMEEELEIARKLQRALLPQRFPRIPRGVPEEESAVQFFSYFRPAGSVSGDFFDVVRVSETAVGVFICDVMGHDVRAALLAAVMRTLVEERRSTDPGQLLAEINCALVGILENSEAPLFATAFYLVVDTARSEMRYANAGHPAALHIHRRDVGINPMNGFGKPGPALGLFDGGVYRTSTCSVAPNDLVMLFTDGLFEVEAPTEELFTYERLVDAVGRRVELPSPAMFAGLFAEIEEFTAHRAFVDDVCVVGIEIRSLPGSSLNNGHPAPERETMRPAPNRESPTM